MKHKIVLIFLMLFIGELSAQLSIQDGLSNYLIDFDGTMTGVSSGAFIGTGFSNSPTNGQLDADAWATTGLSDGAKPFGVANTSGDHAQGSSTGGVTSGGFYGFDIGGGNRALGVQPSGSDWTPGTLTLKIDNNSSSVINEMDIDYVIYVRNDQNRASNFNFSFSTDDNSYSDIPSADYTSPLGSGSTAWAPNNRSIQLIGLQINPGNSIYIRWSGSDAGGSGSRDELALDDLSIMTESGPILDCVEPTMQASNLIFGTITSHSIQASFTESAADKYLVVQSLDTSLGSLPLDTIIYNVGDSIGTGEVIQYSNNNSFNSIGLTADTTYYYFIYASNDNCSGGPDYLITNPLSDSATTQEIGDVSNYYDNIGSETCEELKTALHNLIDGHTSVTYGALWTHYQTTDAHLNDAGNEVIVWDMYSDNPTGPENEFTFGTEQCGNFQQEGDCYNREHSFPKSWWGGSTSAPQYTDMFMVVPSDGWVNGLRGNYPYGEVQSGTEIDSSENGCKLGSSEINIPGYSGPVFEPTDPYKGDFARGYFYTATRYEDQIAGWENSNTSSDVVLNGSSFKVFEPWVIDMLISWHNGDPVDQKEIDRNEAIFAIQGNRNPYIDHPEYVADIWSGCEGGAIDSCIYVYKIADAGPGSLRAAIGCAVENDTIRFSPDVYDSTIVLTSNSIVINNKIVLEASGNNNIRVTSESPQLTFLTTIFKIENGAEVTLKGFTIEGVLGPDGSAICNDGLLTIENMVISSGGNLNINSVLLNQNGGTIFNRGINLIE